MHESGAGSLQIVLPLVAADLQRYLRVQRPTLERYYRDLDRTWIVTRPQDLEQVRAAVRDLAGVSVSDERELVPEAVFKRDPRPSRRRRRREHRDWYLQQLIKLAAVAELSADFVLLLDADVLAVRAFSDADLVRGGRAVRPREPRIKYQEWLDDAARVLGLDPLDYQATVTPCVLSSDAVRALADYVVHHVEPRGPRLGMARFVPGLRRHALSWRGRLLAYRWTEYQLYDTYLVRTGAFDRYHVDACDPISGNEVHETDEFAQWDPRPPATTVGPMFSLVQSRTAIEAPAIEARLRAFGLL